MMSSRALAHSILALSVAGTAMAQAPQAPVAPPKPDTPAVLRHVDAARKAAGTEWTQAVEFICSADQSRANRPDDPEIEPTKIAFEDSGIVLCEGLNNFGPIVMTVQSQNAVTFEVRTFIVKATPRR